MRNQVTVAIPVYNGEKYLPEALQSITNQTHKVDQILICDNHSTDNTIPIIEKFISEHPGHTFHLHQNEKNIGPEHNFNKCMELCDTKFLIILGADDRLKPEAVRKQLELFEEMPELALIGGHYEPIDGEGKSISKPAKKETVIFKKGDILEFMRTTGFYMQHSTIMFNMDCTRKVGFYDTRYIASDERLNVTHLLKYPIAQIGEALVDSRFHKGQATQDERSRFDDKIMHFKANMAMAKYESTPERIAETEKLLKKWVADQCVAIGRSVWKNQGNPSVAIKYWKYGIKHNPYIVFKYRFWKSIGYSLLNR